MKSHRQPDSFFWFSIFNWLYWVLVIAWGSLAGACGIWFPNQRLNRVPCIGGTESQPLDRREVPTARPFCSQAESCDSGKPLWVVILVDLCTLQPCSFHGGLELATAHRHPAMQPLREPGLVRTDCFCLSTEPEVGHEETGTDPRTGILSNRQ